MRCKYIRKIFQNEENGYTVALFSTLDHEVPLSARDKFWADKKIIAFTAKGYDLPLTDEIFLVICCLHYPNSLRSQLIIY